MKKNSVLKLLSLMLCVLMLLSVFASCENSNEETMATDSETKTEGSETESGTEGTSETDTETTSESKSETTTETASETESESKTETTSETASETESESETETTTETDSESETEGTSETTETDTETVTETDTVTETASETDTESATETSEQTETTSETETETESETETDKPKCNGKHEAKYDTEGHWRDACEEHDLPAITKKEHQINWDTGAYACIVCGYKPTCKGIHTILKPFDDSKHHIGPCDYCTYEGDFEEFSRHKYEWSRDGYRCKDCGYEPECKGLHGVNNGDGTHTTSDCDICGASASDGPELHVNFDCTSTYCGVCGANDAPKGAHDCALDKHYVYYCKVCGFEPECNGEHVVNVLAGGHSIETCDKCGLKGTELEAHNINELVEESIDGYKVYKYICTVCRTIEKTKSIPMSMVYMSAQDLYSTNTLNSNCAKSYAGGVFRLDATNGGGAEEIFTRHPRDSVSVANDGYEYVLGQAKYFVLRMRGNADGAGVKFSTDQYNRWDENGEETSNGTSYFTVVNISVTEEWQVFVFDASELTPNVFKMNPQGNYVLDLLTIQETKFEVGEYIEIDYISFAKDFKEIHDVADGGVVNMLTAIDGTSEAIDFTARCTNENNHFNDNCDTICDVCGETGIPAGPHINTDCGNDKCDNCDMTGIKGPDHYNGDCGDDVCDRCPATGIKGPDHINKDCGDDECDNCPATGIKGPDHVNGSCATDICDFCGATGVQGKHSLTEHKNTVGSKNVYEYVCSACGVAVYTKEVPTNVNMYLTPNDLNKGAAYNATSSVSEDNVTFYYHHAGADKSSQHIWLRESYTLENGKMGGGGSKFTGKLDIGNARYLVVKARTDETDVVKNGGVSFTISTTAYNTDTPGAPKKDVYSVAQKVTAPVKVINKWTVAVIDLTVLGEKYALDPKTNTYILDTFYLDFSGGIRTGKSIDIAYIAFVDDWSEVNGLVDESIVNFVNDKGEVSAKTPAGVDTDPCAAGHTNMDCDTVCDICGAGGQAPGAAHTNKDCDTFCDVCGADGQDRGAAHINKNCDTICDFCGLDGQEPGIPHKNVNFDAFCDGCGTAVAEMEGALVLNGTALVGVNGSKNNSTASVNGDGNYLLDRTDDTKTGHDRLINSKNDLYPTDIGTPLNVGSAGYILIKYKLTGDATPYRLIISTTGASSRNPESGDKDANGKFNYSGVSSLNLDGAADTWQYKLIYAPTAFLNYDSYDNTKSPIYLADKNSGGYIIDTLSLEMRTAGSSDLVVGYIAFADDIGEVEDVLAADADAANLNKVIVVQQTHVATAGYGLNPVAGTTVNATLSAGAFQHSANCGGICSICGATGLTAVGTHNVNCGNGTCTRCGATGFAGSDSHLSVTTANAGNIYTTTCSICGKVVATKDFSATVEGGTAVVINKLLTPTWMLDNAQQYTKGTESVMASDGAWHWRYVSTSGIEHGFMRENYSESTGSLGTGGSIDVGTSEYMVVRAKVTTSVATNIYMRISTTGYNIEDNQAGSSGQISVSAQAWVGEFEATESNVWKTFVVDLKALTVQSGRTTDKIWVKDGDKYVIDTFALVGGGDTTDIAYIAFVNTEAEANALAAADAATQG